MAVLVEVHACRSADRLFRLLLQRRRKRLLRPLPLGVRRVAVLKDVLYRGFSRRWVLDVGHVGSFILAAQACKSKYHNGLHFWAPATKITLSAPRFAAYHRFMKTFCAALILTDPDAARNTTTVMH